MPPLLIHVYCPDTAELDAGIFVKYLRVDPAAISNPCELNGSFPNNADWICSKEQFLNRPSSPYPNNRSFLLSVVGDGLEVWLKHLKTTIKIKVEKTLKLQR